jgi:hypothetical protein
MSGTNGQIGQDIVGCSGWRHFFGTNRHLTGLIITKDQESEGRRQN